MEPSRRSRLVEVGFEFAKSRDEVWQENFEKLQAYVAKHGDARISISADKDRTLSNWVMVQRSLYRDGTLSKERQEKLEAVGFVWRVRNRSKNDHDDSDNQEDNDGSETLNQEKFESSQHQSKQ